MKKFVITTLALGVLFAAIWAATFFWKNFRGVGPALLPPPADITEIIDRRDPEPDSNTETPIAPAENRTPFPLSLPDGFSISIFAKNLPGARVMQLDMFGNMWVSQTAEGIVSFLELGDDGVVDQSAVFHNLRKPHGLAFDPLSPAALYIAEEDKISRVTVYSDGPIEPLIDLPSDGGHFTRTIAFGPDNRFYISIGSSCNVCNETDARRAKIFTAGRDGTNFTEFARGLRNAVFFAWHPNTNEMWATEMGRDLLGDDTPPDEINIVREGNNYGWPDCYGKQITDADKRFAPPDRVCRATEPSHIDIPAHSAPLGLAFIPATGSWPKEYWHDLIVAYHGSWNRSEPTGYTLVRMKLDENGNFLGAEDFITGWLTPEGALGRPVDILIRPEGVMYVSDDKAGVIYEIRPRA